MIPTDPQLHALKALHRGTDAMLLPYAVIQTCIARGWLTQQNTITASGLDKLRRFAGVSV